MKFKFKLKKIIKNFKLIEILLFSISIYFPLFFSNLLLNFSEFKAKKDLNNLQEKVSDAKSQGYKPFYIPKETQKLKKGFFPLGSLPHTNTYLCDEGYGLIKYKTDRFGLRNDDRKWDLINTERRKSFFIGDSFVAGACVEGENTISGHYQDISGQLTFNLGVSGASPVHYQGFIEMFLEPLYKYQRQFKDDNVIMAFYYNDNCNKCFRNAFEKRMMKYEPIKYQNESILLNQNYENALNEIVEKVNRKLTKVQKNNIKKEFPNIMDLLKLKSLKTHVSRITYSIGMRKNYNKNDASEKAVASLKKLCAKNCNPYIIYIPPMGSNDILGSNRYKSHLKDLSNRYGLSFIDLEDTIDGRNREDYAPQGAHLSNKGYKKIAKKVNSFLNP